MTISKSKRIISFVLIFLTLICVPVVLFFSLRSVNAQVDTETSTEIATEYAFGDIFKVPSCTFTIDGKSAVGSATVEYPSGEISNKAELSLNQTGTYLVKYLANLDGKVYTKEYSFTVAGKIANYTNSKTSIEYGLCTHLGASTEGLMVKIANGDALSFDHVFDMSNLSMDKTLVEGFIVPEVQGSIDFARMIFTFTDVEDPSVQLVYHGNFYDDPHAYGLTWFTAAGNGQVHCGLEHVGKLHVGKTQGCIVPHSFMAIDTGLYWGGAPASKVAPDDKQFSISYDAKSNQAWAGGKIVSDLDDSYYYDKLWFGFPSGKAKLTISAANYNGPTANICFTSILGVDLTARAFIDDVAPTISVDCEYDVMPNARVSTTETDEKRIPTYPVPSATAIDSVSGNCSVDVSVWYAYGTDDAQMVDVVDGKFKTTRVGTYAIVYKATDVAGNTATEILWVRAVLEQRIPKLTVSINDFDNNVEVGTLQTIPTVTVEGGSGNKTVTYTLTKGNEECEIVDGKYRIEKAGEWTLVCTVTDYIGQINADACIINASVGDRPIVIDEPYLPKAYISGSTYVLPALYAYDYSTGVKEKKLCSVKVSYGNSVNEFKSGQSFTPKVDADKDLISISYLCDGESVFEKKVPVRVVLGKELIEGGEGAERTVLDTSKYFFTEDHISLVKNYNLASMTGLLVRADAEQEKSSVEFINPQVADAFAIALYTVPNAGKFSGLSLILKDSVNPSVSVRASLTKDAGQTVLTVGKTSMTLNIDFDGGVAENYKLGYANKNIVINSNTTVAITEDENGKAFNGFPSGKIYFELEMVDVKEGASLFINEICGIRVANNEDNISPIIVADGVETNGFKDAIYTVKKAIVGDVLCPNSTATLTVVSPSGEVVTSVDGIKLNKADPSRDYQITLSEYGNYRVLIEATEESSWEYTNKKRYNYTVTVIDGERPTITFTAEFKKTLKVGEELSIPAFTVTDNFSTADKIDVMITVTNPKGMPIYLNGEDKSFVCKYEGKYKISIFVVDEMGNLTKFETEVVVTR